MDLRLGYFTSLDEDFEELLRSSLEEGYQDLQHFKDSWESGESRFDKDGENHIVAVEGTRPVGICVLDVDPYDDNSKTGRLRHLYVHPDFRGLTIGTILVAEIIEAASEHFEVLRLKTNDKGVSDFYIKLGFNKNSGKHETHRKTLTKEFFENKE